MVFPGFHVILADHCIRVIWIALNKRKLKMSEVSEISGMSNVIHACAGGTVVLPGKVLCDRRDGGHLLVNPPRPVWERSCLTPEELALSLIHI